MAREYDKLVRDRVPAVIRDDGERPVTHVAGDEEYERRLAEKLVEEAREYRESQDTGELADVLAVVEALCEYRGIDADRLDALRLEKAEERGRFEQRIVLERVEPDGSS